jgi:hypothetical protein
MTPMNCAGVKVDPRMGTWRMRFSSLRESRPLVHRGLQVCTDNKEKPSPEGSSAEANFRRPRPPGGRASCGSPQKRVYRPPSRSVLATPGHC